MKQFPLGNVFRGQQVSFMIKRGSNSVSVMNTITGACRLPVSGWRLRSPELLGSQLQTFPISQHPSCCGRSWAPHMGLPTWAGGIRGDSKATSPP